MNSPSTIAEQLREMGVGLVGKAFMNPRGADGKSNNHIAPGVAEINERIHDGRLKISVECDVLLKQIEQWQYDANGTISTNQKDDAIDAFRYAVMSIIQGLGDPIGSDVWAEYEDEYEELQTY